MHSNASTLHLLLCLCCDICFLNMHLIVMVIVCVELSPSERGPIEVRDGAWKEYTAVT